MAVAKLSHSKKTSFGIYETGLETAHEPLVKNALCRTNVYTTTSIEDAFAAYAASDRNDLIFRERRKSSCDDLERWNDVDGRWSS